MKKTITIAVIVWCLFLWLWFLFGRSSNVSKNIEEPQKEDLFKRQNQCINMYTSVKQYLTDQYEFWDDEKWENYQRINNIEIRYSPSKDSCIASVEYYLMSYRYTIQEHYYQVFEYYELLDISNWYKRLYLCENTVSREYDCRDDYIFKKSEYHN